MAISQKEIKILWGRSAGICAMCQISLSQNTENSNSAFAIGECAHIFAEKSEGPRGDGGIPAAIRNSYENLMLLCPTCHAIIDKNPAEYPAARLTWIKNQHESAMRWKHLPDKDSYDENLGFSKISKENWLASDLKNYEAFLEASTNNWIDPFFEARLQPSVPSDVIKAFEVARGCMIHAYHFYPLASLGLEQVCRVGVFAVKQRAKTLKILDASFEGCLAALIDNKIVSPEDAHRLEAFDFFTKTDRPAGVSIFSPGDAICMLNSLAELLNRLF